MIIKLSKEEVYLYHTWRMKINPLKSFIEAIELNLIQNLIGLKFPD